MPGTDRQISWNTRKASWNMKKGYKKYQKRQQNTCSVVENMIYYIQVIKERAEYMNI